MQHAVKTGLIPMGEQRKTSKLTEKQVLEIRTKYVPRKYTYSKLAKEYNVEYATIFELITRKTWKHI